MHNICTTQAISTEKATDLMFTGFRTVMREGGTSTVLTGGPDTFRVVVDVENPRTNQVGGQKYWDVQLHHDGAVVAYAFADEHDL